MEPKPFSLQAPEGIAKEYGGNKQKIAQAMQMGIVDPTAGVLAGMFIDRLRSAAMAEQAPPQTVAQDTFAPRPPQGAPPQAGLGALPVPDAMFEGPEGGMVQPEPQPAFADGGKVSPLGPWFEEMATKHLPGLVVTSGARDAAKNKVVGGVPNSYHLTDNARDFVPPKGMSMGALQARLRGLFGADYDIINEGDHVHVEPGSKKGRGVTTTAAAPTVFGGGEPLTEVDMTSRQGRRVDFAELLNSTQEYLGGPTPDRDAYSAFLGQKLDPEAQKKGKKQDMWEALAQMGFSMAASKSPYFLQAMGEAGSQTVPRIAAARKEREASEQQAYAGKAALEGQGRSEKIQGLGIAGELYGKELSAEQSEKALGQQAKLHGDEIASRERIAKMENDARAAAAKAASSGKQSDYEGAVQARLAAMRLQRDLGVGFKSPKGSPYTDADLLNLAHMQVRKEMNADPNAVPVVTPGQAAPSGGQVIDYSSME